MDVKRGGVGLYVKESCPVVRRPELEILPECIICEIKLNGKKHFFVVLYRSPSQSHFEFENFLNIFEKLISLFVAKNPYSLTVTGDFNCRSSKWWKKDIDSYEGKLFESITSDLGQAHFSNGPTHFMGEYQSCIDLIFTDQPNLFAEAGVGESGACCHKSIIAVVSNIVREVTLL